MEHYKYKDCGIDWIGLVPDQWRTIPLKYIGTIAKGRKASEDFQDYADGLIPYLSMQYLRGQTESPLYVKSDDPAIVLVEGNDLLVLWDGSKAGEIVKAKKGALSSTMGRIRLTDDGFDLRFLIYYLKNSEAHLQSNTVGMGIPHVDGDILKNLLLVKPTLEEQTQIVCYLDHQTATIDSLLEKKEELVELLKEKRQTIINEAVTNGVNTKGKMKDSGIEWLGEIPEKWPVLPIRYLNGKIGSGVTPKGGAEVYVDNGIIFIRSQNVHFDGLRLDDVVKIELDTHQKMSGSKVEYRDVLLNITGASIGRSCVVNVHGEMNVNQHVCIIRPNDKIDADYLNFVLQSNVGQIQIKLLTTGGNREGLTFEAIKEFKIPVPEVSTQLKIVEHVFHSLKTVNSLEEKCGLQIERLKEYRQSIISEAVTGKVDVRDWKPKNLTTA